MHAPLLLLVVAATMFLTIGCDDRRGWPSPSPSTPVTLSRLIVEGSEVVPLGGTATFRLTAGYSDNSAREVTSEARWSTASPRISFDAPGLLRGLEIGAASFQVEFQGRIAGRSSLVLASGTFRLQGRITEDGLGLPDAQVLVTSGVGAGLMTRTLSDGSYVIYGVAGSIDLAVERSGYFAERRSVDVASNAARVDVAMRAREPHPDVSGVYAVTISASDRCRTGGGVGSLPEEARLGTYSMVVTQDGARLSGQFYAGDVVGEPFIGQVVDGRFVWWLSNGDVYDEVSVIVGRLASGAILASYGTAVVSGTGSTLAGTLGGTLEVLDPVRSRNVPLLAACEANDHRFVMRR